MTRHTWALWALTALVVLTWLVPVLPPDLGCHRITGHHHGHGRPVVVCIGG